MTAQDYFGPADPALAAALATPFSWPESGLEPLPWFPFTVAASRGATKVAERVAQRTERAYWYLRKRLGAAPRFRLLVLDQEDWAQHASGKAYGVTHVTRDGHLAVGAEPAAAWHDVSRFLTQRLPASVSRALVKVHGADAKHPAGPDLSGVSELLVAHELAHLVAAQAGAWFPRRWLSETFANYALVAVLCETDPAGMHRIGTLVEAASLLEASTPSVGEFEAAEGTLVPACSVLTHLRLTRVALAAYAEARAEPLARWFALACAQGTQSREPDADHELGRLLAGDVHPALARLVEASDGIPLARAA